MSSTDPRWTITELAAEVSLALSSTALVPADARAREVPDARTIRYYTTLGLLDGPAELRGRTAFYGRKHLAQLVAIKRLQAAGHTLAEVQERLAGLPTRRVLALAALPAAGDRSGLSEDPPRRSSTPARPRFWATPPAELSPIALEAVAAPALSIGVALTGGAQLLFTPARSLDVADVDAIRTASSRLMAVLAERGLLSSYQPPTALPQSSSTNDEPDEGAHR